MFRRLLVMLVAISALSLNAAPFHHSAELDSSKVVHQDGHLYAVSLSQAAPSGWLGMFLEARSDDTENPTRSGLTLSVGTSLLGPAHSPHKTISDLGGGRFSHWQSSLFFSGPGGSDPRSDGRGYVVRYPIFPAFWILALAWTVVVAELCRALCSEWAKAKISRIRSGFGSRLIGGILGGAGVAILVWSAYPPEISRALELVDLSHLGGNSFQWEVPELGPLAEIRGDMPSAPQQSGLRLLEDGLALARAHALHSEIREGGRGVYSHWGGHLYFSSSDNSSPLSNGRRYTAEFPVHPAMPLLIVAAVSMALSIYLSWAALAAFRSAAARLLLEPSLRVKRLLTAHAPWLAVAIVSAWYIYPPVMRYQMHASDMFSGEGMSVRWKVPDFGLFGSVESDTGQNPTASKLEVFEDGALFRAPHSYHKDVSFSGGGRYSHWSGDLFFSASDGSDPITNGRRYAASFPVNPGPLVSLCAALALVVVVFRMTAHSARAFLRAGALAALAILAFGAWSRYRPFLADMRIPWSFVRTAKPVDGNPSVHSFDVRYLPWPFVELATYTKEMKLLASLRVNDSTDLAAKIGLAASNNDLERSGKPFFKLSDNWARFILPADAESTSATKLTFRAPVKVTKGGLLLASLTLLAALGGLVRLRGLAGARCPAPRLIAEICSCLGALLLALNLAGLTLPLGREDLRGLEKDSNFGLRDRSVTWEETVREIARLSSLQDKDTVTRELSMLVSHRMAHNWWYINLDELDLQMPLWENWYLWLLGEFRESFRRYNIGDPYLALQRGVGNCGQASMILTQLLREQGIESKILTLRGHTLVWARTGPASEFVLDPDYGVVFRGSFDQYAGDKAWLEASYREIFAQMGTPERRIPGELNLVKAAVEYGNPGYIDFEGFFGAGNLEYEAQAYALKWWIPMIALAPFLAVCLAGILRERLYGSQRLQAIPVKAVGA